ncbi:MAG: lytic transglycosylase [Deltaproteobacteria bacterium HGW-Deltaproteobacteria-15]|jgi:soluble lytic murein transglycosylase|nr:MAG: lytic transglycosylase [Deltaproteobacteria bacterium HGW-Deltaproteobacteria-15]
MKRRQRILLILLSCLSLTAAAGFLIFDTASAEIRGYVDKKGFFRFPGLKQSGPAEAAVRSASFGSYEKIIEEASGMYRVETGLVKAVIRAESDFNPTAVSHKGALGLMQLMPGTAALMEVDNPFDPAENVLGGTRYLSQLLSRFNGDKILALAAYNAGPEKVAMYQGVPPYEETKMYVRKVMEYYKAYSRK